MDEIVNKRILLAKEFHLNGIEMSKRKDPLSKMMAIHNYHIGIEITVKSILLKYEIRNEKTLNLNFESMLNEIDKYNKFNKEGKKLPYRQEIRNLNQIRNLVQHHAFEPDESTMDDWRLFSSRFLSKVFFEYFNVNFDEINRISFISDSGLQQYLRAAMKYLSLKEFESASCFVAASFEYAVLSINSFIPNDNSSFFIQSTVRNTFSELQNVIDDTLKRIDRSERFCTLLASGINLSDYKKYKDCTPSVSIMAYGNPFFDLYNQDSINSESCNWLIKFVISSIIKWQQLDLDPKIPDHLKEVAIKSLQEQETEIDNN